MLDQVAGHLGCGRDDGVEVALVVGCLESSGEYPLPLRAWVPGQERLDEGSETGSFLEQEPVPGIGVEHQSRPRDEAGEGVVIDDRVELVVGAGGDKGGR